MKRLRAVAILIVGVACARYQWVPDSETPECRGHRLGSRVRVSRADSSAPPGVVLGRLSSTHPGAPLEIVNVFIGRPPRGHNSAVDSRGRFRLEGVAAGRHFVRARAIGFAEAADSVTVPLQPFTELEIVLIPQVIDGPCSGFAVVRVRKPWWKLW